jgi:hypothetical protein
VRRPHRGSRLGSIINIASVAGFNGDSDHRFTVAGRYINSPHGRHGVGREQHQVNCISPGFVVAGRFEAAGMTRRPMPGSSKVKEHFATSSRFDGHACQRTSRGNSVAGQRRSSFVNSAGLVVDGDCQQEILDSV